MSAASKLKRILMPWAILLELFKLIPNLKTVPGAATAVFITLAVVAAVVYGGPFILAGFAFLAGINMIAAIGASVVASYVAATLTAYAISGVNSSIAEALINKEDNRGNTALMRAAKEGDKDKVTDLLNKGASINNQYGRKKPTALIYAAQKGHYAIVEALLNAKADKDYKDSAGRTALMWAEINGHKQCVELLKIKQQRRGRRSPSAIHRRVESKLPNGSINHSKTGNSGKSVSWASSLTATNDRTAAATFQREIKGKGTQGNKGRRAIDRSQNKSDNSSSLA